VNEFWRVLKGLEGRTVKSVEERVELDHGEEVSNGFYVECEDGYTVKVWLDYEDVDLEAEEVQYPEGKLEEVE
jgi:hypothetical protein